MCSLEEAFQPMLEPKALPAAEEARVGKRSSARRRVRASKQRDEEAEDVDRPAGRSTALPPPERLRSGARGASAPLPQAAPPPSFAPNDAVSDYLLDPDWAASFAASASVAQAALHRGSGQRQQQQAEEPFGVTGALFDGLPTLWEEVRAPPQLQQPPRGGPLSAEDRPRFAEADAFGWKREEEGGKEGHNSRLDELFARLEALEDARAATSHVDLLLFVLAGVLLLLCLHTLVKQGARLLLLGAAARGGGRVSLTLLEELQRL